MRNRGEARDGETLLTRQHPPLVPLLAREPRSREESGGIPRNRPPAAFKVEIAGSNPAGGTNLPLLPTSRKPVRQTTSTIRTRDTGGAGAERARERSPRLVNSRTSAPPARSAAASGASRAGAFESRWGYHLTSRPQRESDFGPPGHGRLFVPASSPNPGFDVTRFVRR